MLTIDWSVISSKLLAGGCVCVLTWWWAPICIGHLYTWLLYCQQRYGDSQLFLTLHLMGWCCLPSTIFHMVLTLSSSHLLELPIDIVYFSGCLPAIQFTGQRPTQNNLTGIMRQPSPSTNTILEGLSWLTYCVMMTIISKGVRFTWEIHWIAGVHLHMLNP